MSLKTNLFLFFNEFVCKKMQQKEMGGKTNKAKAEYETKTPESQHQISQHRECLMFSWIQGMYYEIIQPFSLSSDE